MSAQILNHTLNEYSLSPYDNCRMRTRPIFEYAVVGYFSPTRQGTKETEAAQRSQ